MKRAGIITAAILLFANTIFAQGTTQISVGGIPPVLPSPFMTDIERNYFNGLYQIQLTYSNTNPEPTAFTFYISLIKDGEIILEIRSDPVFYTPGIYYYRTFDNHPPVYFPSNPLDKMSSGVAEQVIREGILPEGSYMLEIKAHPIDPFSNITSIPGIAYFEVRLPQPPVLISPIEDSHIPPLFTAFSWTPVRGPPGYQFEYELLLVEVIQGQTPLQAIEANREHVRVTTTQPLVIYTEEFLELEPGKMYAWMVRAREINDLIPISDEGKTEIYTFRAGHLTSDVAFDHLEQIQIIPGFAELIHLEHLDVTDGQYSLTLNGFATLRLHSPDGGSGFVDITVECRDLQIQAGTVSEATVIGGRISGNVITESLPYDGVGEIITVEGINWSLLDGLTIDASIIDFTGSRLKAEGKLSLSPAGIFGTITAKGPSGAPLIRFGRNPMELALNKITANFPEASLSFESRVHFFGQPTPCHIADLGLTESFSNMQFSCMIDEAIPLVPGNELATLFLNHAYGEITLSSASQEIDYELTVLGAVRLEALGKRHYSLPSNITLSSSDGISLAIQSPNTIIDPPLLDLGIGKIKINDIKDPNLAYNPNLEEWDFRIGLDVDLLLPDLDNLRFPNLNGIKLDQNGIHFPERVFQLDELQWIPRLDFAGFGARLLSFTLPSFTFPWFEWDSSQPGPWNISFDFELTTPNFRNYLPSCLRNLSFMVTNASMSGGAFSATFPSKAFSGEECSIEFGGGHDIAISQIAGGIYGEVQAGSLVLDGFISLDAALRLGAPFDCGDESPLDLGSGNLTVRSNGSIEGEIADIIPGCPLKVGPYSAGMTSTLLSFNHGTDGQRAFLDGSAFLEFPTQGGGTSSVRGDVGVNLITGDLYKLNFEISEPFVWVVPAEDEVLKFNVDKAIISLDGLWIDGTQEFVVGDETLDVVFEELVLDSRTFHIKNGSITFSDAFSFEIGIDPSDFSLKYHSVPLNSRLSLDPGILLNLAGQLRIDNQGFHSLGEADAKISLGSVQIDDLSVLFSDNFAFGLDPFKVASGEIEIRYDSKTIAVIDEFGFHPMFSFFDLDTVIPERLPLPNHSIAYIILKENDEFLIDIEQDPDTDLAVRISTKPGRSVDFVFPIIQGNAAEPPRLGVEFSDVVVSLSPFQFYSGEIHVNVPDHFDHFDLTRFGLPLSLRHISYGKFEIEELLLEGLFFTGNLVLFEKEISPGSAVTMHVDDSGLIAGSIDLVDLQANIPLVPGSDLAVISVQSVSGYSEFNLLQPSLHDFHFSIDGGFGISVEEHYKAQADVTIEYSRQGLLLRKFEYDAESQRPRINIDPFILQVNEVHSLNLSHDEERGFDFYSKLDVALGMKFDDGDTLLIPLQGVELRPNGFAIPAQELNDGSVPRLRLPNLSLLGFELEPLAFRIDNVVIDVFDFSAGDLAGLIPRMDFAISFPHLAELSPRFADISLTVNNAGYKNGILTAEFELPVEPLPFSLGNPTFNITKFEGNLYEILRENRSRQGINVTVEGTISGLDYFKSDEPCEQVAFALSIVEGSGFKGTIDNFVPCGKMPIGELSLQFTSSEVTFDFVENEQIAILSGVAAITLPASRARPDEVTVYGALSLDLLTGTIRDGAIEITDPFQWNIPAGTDNPLFTFTVQSARLDTLGLTLKADGSLSVTDDISAHVAFDDLLIDLQDLRIKDGEATISSDFSFELVFLPIDWRIVHPDKDLPLDTNVVRMNLQGAGITLNKEGLSLVGESTAQIRIAQNIADNSKHADTDDEEKEHFRSLRLVLKDNFTLDFPPVRATKGRAEFWLDEGSDKSELIAWYDEEGLGFGDILGLLPVPDSLGLPNPDIAYILLRDESDGLLVELETDDNVRTLKTKDGKTVDLVIAGMTDDKGNHPTFATQFSITVNDAFEILDGAITVDLHNNPYNVSDLPLQLTSLKYERRDDGVRALTASAFFDLPESLNELRVSIDELRFSESGFEQTTFSIGKEDFDEDDDPAIAKEFADSSLVLNVFYAKAAFGEQSGFALKGTIQSSFFRDEETDKLASLPFEADYVRSDNPGSRWEFTFPRQDTVSISYALFVIDEINAVATSEEFAVGISGVVMLPDIFGDDFAITVEALTIGTKGIHIGEIAVTAQEQEFSFFDGRVKTVVSRISPSYENRVLYIEMDGTLEVLDKEVSFRRMKVGTDRSFSIDGEIDISLLDSQKDESIAILGDYLVINQLRLGLNEHMRLRLAIDAMAKIPAPFDESAEVNVVLSQIDRYEVDIDVKGPHFKFDREFPILDVATAVLTGVAVDLDFKNLEETTLYASATLYLENDDGTRSPIEFGTSTDIYENWGFRYNFGDRLNWRITTRQSGEDILEYEKGFFKTAVSSITPLDYETYGFGVEVAGYAKINLKGVSGGVGLKGVKISSNGIDWGEFDGAAGLTLLGVVKLNLDIFEFSRFSHQNPGSITLTEEKEDSGMENPDTIKVNIPVLEYLHISGAKITMNEASSNGHGDMFEGGIDKVYFYRTLTNEYYLYIDNAHIELSNIAAINVSMRYMTVGDNYSLSVAGGGKFGQGDSGVEIAVAGKIENIDNKLSFGLFVKAEAGTGIPIVPGIVTLKGAGGGFYYRPVKDDFEMVRGAAGLNYQKFKENGITQPSYNENIKFAVFLYARAGIVPVGSGDFIDGKLFLEVTDQFTTLFVDGVLMDKKDQLTGFMCINVQYGSDQNNMVQALIGLDVNFPALEGTGRLGFFAKDDPEGIIWAVYGEASAKLLFASGDASFIFCNDGMLVDVEIGVEFLKSGFGMTGNLGAAIWYVSGSGFGIFGEIGADIFLFGYEVAGAELYGAYLSQQNLFYAAGSVYVDVWIFKGSTSVWASISGQGFDGGTGVNPGLEQLVADSRAQAEALKDRAEAAQNAINEALAELAREASIGEQIKDAAGVISDMPHVKNASIKMDNKISYVTNIAPPVIDKLANVQEELIDLRDETVSLAADLKNPATISKGGLVREADQLTVHENPTIIVDENIASSQEEDLENLQKDIELLLEYYEEAIAKAMANLETVEIILEGHNEISGIIQIQTVKVLGRNLTFGLPLTGDIKVMTSPSQEVPKFSTLAEKYTEAVEAIKEYYALFVSELWKWPFDDDEVKERALTEFNAEFDELLLALENGHAAFTESIDHLYLLFTEMLVTVYGMVEDYAYIVETELHEDPDTEIKSMSDDLLVKLEQPVITSVAVYPNPHDYHNRAEIRWEAHHPEKIVETSYSISNKGFQRFTSAGNKQSLTHHSHRREPDEKERVYNIAIRARGSGGHTRIERTQVSLGVHPDGESSAPGEQLREPVPPPSTPIVSFPYHYDLNQYFVRLQGMITQTPRQYWTNDQDKIDLIISATSEEGDIESFSFALGTYRGGTDVVDWTKAVGVIEGGIESASGLQWPYIIYINEPEQSDRITRRTTTSIPGPGKPVLNLVHNQPYYVSVRAHNSAGYSENNLSSPILYDETPPSEPTIYTGIDVLSEPVVSHPFTRGSLVSHWTVYPQVATSPTWENGKFNYPSNDRRAPSVWLRWNASEDPESGILEYEYVLTKIADAGTAFQHESDIKRTDKTEIILRGFPLGDDPVTYTDSLYLHLRSVNKAGNKSSPLTYHPVIAHDPNPPTPPKVNVRIAAFDSDFRRSLNLFSVRLHFPLLSVDGESQVKGYQYSIGTTPGRTDVSDWGDIMQPWEFTAESPHAGYWMIHPEPVQVPQLPIAIDGLPHRTDLYINVRAVNGQGLKSSIAVTGPFQLGTTPEVPVVSLRYNDSNNTLQITVDNIYDPGVPIRRVQYRISEYGGGILTDWTSIEGVSGMFTEPVNATITCEVPKLAMGYTVDVRITNITNNSTVGRASVSLVLKKPIVVIPPRIIRR